MSQANLIGAFEQLIMLALAKAEQPLYGMEVRREIERRTGRNIAIGAVYQGLERLQAKEMVSSRSGGSSPERRGRGRRYFSLEPAGAEALLELRKVSDQMWMGVDLVSLVRRSAGES